MTKKYYAIAIAAMVILLINAFCRTVSLWDRKEGAGLERYPLLSYADCLAREPIIEKALEGTPATAQEYFDTLGDAYDFLGSAKRVDRKVLSQSVADPRYPTFARGLVLEIQGRLDDYAKQGFGRHWTDGQSARSVRSVRPGSVAQSEIFPCRCKRHVVLVGDVPSHRDGVGSYPLLHPASSQ